MLPSEYTRLSHVTCRWQGGLRSHVKALHLKGGLPANPPPSWLVGVKRQQRRAHGERGQHPLRWFHPRELPRLGATVRCPCVASQMGSSRGSRMAEMQQGTESSWQPYRVRVRLIRHGPTHRTARTDVLPANRETMLASYGAACSPVPRPVFPIRSHRESQRRESHALASIRLGVCTAGDRRRRLLPAGRARCSVEMESQVGNEAHEGTVAAPRRARRLKGLKLSSPRDVALAQVVLPAPPALSRTLPPTGVCVRSTGSLHSSGGGG